MPKVACAALEVPRPEIGADAATAARGCVGGGGISGVHELPVAGQSGGGQRRRLEERGAAEVEAVEEVRRVRIAAGQRAEVELRLDEAQHRRVVVHDV